METNTAVKAHVEIEESATESDLVNKFSSSFEYQIVAIGAPVNGKVYAHHARENLQIHIYERHHHINLCRDSKREVLL